MILTRALLLSLLLAAPVQAEKLANKLFGAMAAPSSQDSISVLRTACTARAHQVRNK